MRQHEKGKSLLREGSEFWISKDEKIRKLISATQKKKRFFLKVSGPHTVVVVAKEVSLGEGVLGSTSILGVWKEEESRITMPRILGKEILRKSTLPNA